MSSQALSMYLRAPSKSGNPVEPLHVDTAVSNQDRRSGHEHLPRLGRTLGMRQLSVASISSSVGLDGRRRKTPSTPCYAQVRKLERGQQQ